MKRASLPAGVAAPVAHAPSGQHVLADLNGISAEKLSNCAALETLLRGAADAAGAQVLFSHFHAFGEGQGVTGVVLLAESHITIHTWPECGFAAADIFMCGNSQPELALALIKKALQPGSAHVHTARRGPPVF
ncbi:adenosylmethionine decarboxylase [Duganella sp. FT50W]|uniref:S-adenosylmethionine decarboxylase proenzyme n=1 Tax=Duganella lactea TaxID=2692173 RepID=A0A6L8MCP4_9BURK|nr:adenosylmethionine decarboxylase [Duganella lactea]